MTTELDKLTEEEKIQFFKELRDSIMPIYKKYGLISDEELEEAYDHSDEDVLDAYNNFRDSLGI